MPDALELRLGRIESQLKELLVNVTKIEGSQKDMQGDLRGIVAEIGGAPEPEARGTRDTIRWRVHKLENDELAARAATAALAAARAADRQAWSRREKAALFFFAVIAATEGLLRLIGVGG